MAGPETRHREKNSMKLSGSQMIAADRMAVWNALNDPDILKRCISGCEEMSRTSPTQYDAVVKQKIGPVSATFKGEVQLSDVREGESLTLQGEGKGGVAGMAKGGAVVTLSDAEGGTLLSYDADASVAGKLAQLGSRLIDGVAQKMVNGFFTNFRDEVESGSGTGATGGVSITNASSSATSSGSAASSSASASGGAAMATAAGAAGMAGAAASSYASNAMQGARDAVDAHTGALHDAAAERMLNPAIGAGSGDIDMDDPDIGDIDVSSIDGGPSESARTAEFDAARAAGSQGAESATDVAGTASAASASFDTDAAVGQVRDHAGTIGDSANAAAASTMAGASGLADQARDGVQNAAERVGERASAGIEDVQDQASAMADDAVAASRSAMEGARDSVSATASGIGASASATADSMAGAAGSSAEAGMDTMRDAAAGVTGAAPDTTMPEQGGSDTSASGISGAGMAAGAAAVGGIGAAVSGLAAKAQDRFEETHDSVRERVIAAGEDVDEAKSWSDTKEHLGRAASETRDTAKDVYEAARARVDGDLDRASAEWNEAKTNASEAYGELKGAGEDAWTTGKGYAAEEAKAPKIGPLGQPWYLWIIGIIVLLVILWIL